MVTGTNDRFLKPGVAIRMIYEVADPNLIIGDFLEGPIGEERKAFPYMYDSASTSSDPKKQTAPRTAGGADLPRIDFSQPSVDAAVIKKKGFEFAIPRDVLMDNRLGKELIKRDYNKAGYIVAEQINTAQLAALTAGATTPTWTPSEVWSHADATPVADLMDFAEQMDRSDEGYAYHNTDSFVNKAGFYELKKYLNFYDGTQFVKDRPVGEMINRDTIYVGAADMTIHKMGTGMTDSYILGVDKNNPGGEFHYYIDPEFAIGGAKISYPTIVDGKKTTKSVDNAGIHFYSYMEKDTKDQILQIWFENMTVVTEPYALMYDSGI